MEVWNIIWDVALLKHLWGMEETDGCRAGDCEQKCDVGGAVATLAGH